MHTTNWIGIGVVGVIIAGGASYLFSAAHENGDAMMQDTSPAMHEEDAMMTASDSPADSMKNESTTTDAMMMEASSSDTMMQ